jgi:hypothetical protein
VNSVKKNQIWKHLGLNSDNLKNILTALLSPFIQESGFIWVISFYSKYIAKYNEGKKKISVRTDLSTNTHIMVSMQ